MRNKRLLIEMCLAHDTNFAVKYMMLLYDRQTLDEQVSENSIHRNRVGFNSADAPVLSVYAEAVRHGTRLTLTELQDICTRMAKYAKQLVPLIKDEELTS